MARPRPRSAPSITAEPSAAARVAQWAAAPAWPGLAAMVAELEPWILRRQMDVTAVPAPTHFEALRAEWMLRHWQEQGLAAELDAVGNVIASRPGTDAAAPALALTAHLDTAFPPGTQPRPEARDGRIWAPGIGDNGSGLAALMALAKLLDDAQVATRAPILFLANVGEEGEGDLKGMRHFFSPTSAYAARVGHTVVVDGPGHDRITAQALPSLRLRLGFEAPGGHSWSNRGRASAVHAAARAAAALLAEIEPADTHSNCNIGWMQGGSAVNAIAAEATLKLDLRAEEPAAIERLEQAARRAAAVGVEQENAAARSGAVKCRIDILGARPGGALRADSPLLAAVRAVDTALGIDAPLERASTDANIPISQGREALRLGAGGRGGGIHTLQEWFDPAGRTLAVQRLLLLSLALSQAALD